VLAPDLTDNVWVNFDARPSAAEVEGLVKNGRGEAGEAPGADAAHGRRPDERRGGGAGGRLRTLAQRGYQNNREPKLMLRTSAVHGPWPAAGRGLLLAAALALGGCSAAPDSPDVATDTAGASQDVDAAGTGDAEATRAALPTLFSIMLGLQLDMTRIGEALWVESYDTIAAAALRVAEHPEIPPEEGQRIARVLSDDMARFQELDGTVHDLSVRLADEAEQQDLAAILTTEAGIREACVECHTAFRERLRDGIGPTR
jgi:hypothetical protein